METGNSMRDVMAQAARGLQDSDDVEALMQLAVDIAVRDVRGADAAALSIMHRHGRVITPAATHDAAREADELQYIAGEGPCLDLMWDLPRLRVPNIATEQRWPAWAAAMAEHSGFQSMLVLCLFTTQDRLGTLNLYASRVDAFDQADVDHGEALAAHIAVAVRSAKEIAGLNVALDGRTVVGQAQGMLMERYGLDATGAFAVLTRVSSHSNRKLRDIARELVDTGRMPGVPGDEEPEVGKPGASEV
jgi:transcriptional regulator with GAF, ATPase, and Fis domain